MSEINIKWATIVHMKFTQKRVHYLQRDNKLGVQRESSGGAWYYFIDNDPFMYTSQDEFIKALKKKLTNEDEGIIQDDQQPTF